MHIEPGGNTTAKRPRILLLSHMYPNPQRPVNGIFVHELVKVLSRDCSIVVVSPIPTFPLLGRTAKYKGTGAIPRRMVMDGITVFYPRFFFIPKFVKFTDWIFYFIFVLPKVIELRKDFDMIYSHWGYPDGLAAWLFARLLGKKVALHVHGNESICFFERSIRKILVKWFLRRIDCIIAVSSDLKTKMVRYYRINEDSVSVIPNGIDTEMFSLLPQELARKRLGLPQNGKMVLTVARLSAEKRIDLLLEAFSKIVERSGNKVRLYVVGDGPEGRKLQEFSSVKSLEDKVTFVGGVPHEIVPVWLSAADVFCLSSDWEGCPVSILEAMGCERPVVSTRVGAVPDLVHEGICGLLVPPGRPDKLADALVDALGRSWDHKAIGECGRSYTWEKTARKVMDKLAG